MYAVVEFLLEDSIEIVPKSWINETGSLCLWPKKIKFYEIAVHIRKRRPPGHDWQNCSIRILSEAETFEEARRKLKKAQFASCSENLSTDPESYGRGKRKKLRPSLFLDDSSESEDDSQNKMLEAFKILPTPPVQSQVEVHGSVEREAQTLPSPCSSTKSMHESGMLKAIFRELRVIRMEQQRQSGEIDALLSSVNTLTDRCGANEQCAVAMPNTSSDVGVLFPIASEEDLRSLELFLADTGTHKSLVTKLRSIGGNNFSDHLRRAARYALSDELAANYSWQGSSSKKTFSSLKLCQVIIDAVIEERPNSTRSEVEDILKTWLRHAKERKLYIKKKDRC